MVFILHYFFLIFHIMANNYEVMPVLQLFKLQVVKCLLTFLFFCQQDQQLQDLSPKSVLTYGQELPQMLAVSNKPFQYIICIEKA